MNHESYTFEILPGLLGTGPPPYQFGRNSLSTAEGVVVKVNTRKSMWIGNFQRGLGGITKVVRSPKENTLCVVADGTAYLVNAFQPEQYDFAPCGPITDLFEIPERNLLVLVDPTRLTACGSAGLLWQTERLSWDGIKITRFSADSILGMCWDAPSGKESTFQVDTETGLHRGGANIPQPLRRD